MVYFCNDAFFPDFYFSKMSKDGRGEEKRGSAGVLRERGRSPPGLSRDKAIAYLRRPRTDRAFKRSRMHSGSGRLLSAVGHFVTDVLDSAPSGAPTTSI